MFRIPHALASAHRLLATFSVLWLSAAGLLASPAPAAAQLIFHSPADDGVSGGVPATLPPGAPVTVHLYFDVGPNGSSSDPCHQGDGDELCGYQLALTGTDLELQSFVPADADVIFNLAAHRIDLIGGRFATGDLGPTKLGDLVIESSLPGGTLDLAFGEIVDTQLLKQSEPPGTIVSVPEPGGAAAVIFGWLVLSGLRRRRDRSWAGSIALLLVLAPLPVMAGDVVFSSAQVIESTPATSPVDAIAADLDGDGDLDSVSAFYNADTVVWQENLDGQGTFGPVQTITTSLDGPRSVFAGDFDRDGDLDLLCTSFSDDTVAWFENVDGQGSFTLAQTLSNTADAGESVFAADLDGDGDLDALSASANDHTIAWYENTDGLGAFGPEQIITLTALAARSVYAADVDGDGDVDVLSAASSGVNNLVWYENTDGLGTFGAQHTISTTENGARSVYAADLDHDGDLDVLSAASSVDRVAWFENTDGQGSFGSAQIIDASADYPVSVFAADVDGDGDLDALSATLFGDTVAWYENSDAAGSFGPAKPLSSAFDGAESVVAADFDGDGDLDVLATATVDDHVAWFENETIHRSISYPIDGLSSTTSGGTESIIAADIDGDGDLDAISASASHNTVAWYANTDGLGRFGPEQIITTAPNRPLSVFAADLDDDGDLDVLSASETDDTLAWYENTDGLGSFGPQRILTTNANAARSVFAADVDGDGDLDVLAASSGNAGVAWYENIDGQGNFGAEQSISTTAVAANSVFAADVDGDGDLDVLAALSASPGAVWYPNTDGLGSFGPEQAIATTAIRVTSVFAGDVDGDGDLDVLSASDLNDTIAWNENTDGLGSFGPQQTVTTTADGARAVFAADMDRDGDIDVLSASETDDTIAWYENTDGLGSFGLTQVVSANADGAASVVAADLDGDGDLDVLSALGSVSRFAWYANNDDPVRFGPEPEISTFATDAYAVFAADVDGDGDLDALSASASIYSAAWYANAGGQGGFGHSQPVLVGGGPSVSVFAADVDGDGDLDVLSALPAVDTIVWSANTDGLGTFGPEQIVTTNADGVRSVFAADLDRDGDLDVLSASSSDATIAWYANIDGLGSFGPEQTITGMASGAYSVFAADVDGDGDLDALSASLFDDTIAWYENTDGLGSFGPQQAITTSADGAYSVVAADLDGDGDPDVLSASPGDDTIAWYENTDGLGSFGPAQTVTTTADGARAVFAADLDRDGDLDVLSASDHDDTVAWYDNTDGLGSFGPEQTVTTTADGVRSVFAADLDRDGDVDVLAAASWDSTIAWYTNRSGQASFHTISDSPDAALQGTLIELLGVELQHLGRAGDDSAELDALVLLVDGVPSTPLASDPVRPLSSAEANALIEDVFVYRDEGSGVFEVGSDTLVGTLSSLSLNNGKLIVDLPSAHPDAQVPALDTGLFFVVANLSATAGSASPRAFRVRHLGHQSTVNHADTAVALDLAPGSGEAPRPIFVFDPTADDDGDGVTNADEVNVHGSDPLDADSDGDGLSDGAEVNVHGSNPLARDTDGDGLIDGDEVEVHGTDVLLADTDGDGLVDGDELTAGTDPFVTDSDGDGISDGHEWNVHGTDPLDPNGDADGDGIADADEISRNTSPLESDTDADGMSDDLDNCPSAYNPLQEDAGGFGSSLPDGIGDACQNGDFNRDGMVDVLDVTLERRGLIGLEPTLDPALPPSAP